MACLRHHLLRYNVINQTLCVESNWHASDTTHVFSQIRIPQTLNLKSKCHSSDATH